MAKRRNTPSINRDKALKSKCDGDLGLGGIVSRCVFAARDELDAIRTARQKTLDNQIMGIISTLAVLAEAFPSSVRTDVNPKEVRAWQNMYVEFLDNLKPTKKNPRKAIEHEKKWLLAECAVIVEIARCPLFSTPDGRISNPYGDYANEDWSPEQTANVRTAPIETSPPPVKMRKRPPKRVSKTSKGRTKKRAKKRSQP